MEQPRIVRSLPTAILRLDPAAPDRWPETLPQGVMVDLAGAERLSASAIARIGERPDERPAFLLLRIGAPRDSMQAQALESGLLLRPDAIVLANCGGRADVQRIGARLAVWEAEAGVVDGRTAIVAEPDANGLLNLASLSGGSARLTGLAWDAGGRYTGAAPLPRAVRQQIRVMLTMAGTALNLPVLDSPEDGDGQPFLRSCRIARRLGFSGKVATSADQMATITRSFATG